VPELASTIRVEALPFLSAITSSVDAAEAAIALRKSAAPPVQEAIAYCFAHAGQVDRAVVALDNLDQLVRPVHAFQFEMVERAKTLRMELMADPLRARARLDLWEEGSVRALGLERFRLRIHS